MRSAGGVSFSGNRKAGGISIRLLNDTICIVLLQLFMLLPFIPVLILLLIIEREFELKFPELKNCELSAGCFFKEGILLFSDCVSLFALQVKLVTSSGGSVVGGGGGLTVELLDSSASSKASCNASCTECIESFCSM